jgi:thioredoxin-related protein
MSRYLHSSIAALLVLAFAGSSHAERDLAAIPSPGSDVELLVVEAEGCIYCPLLRRDLLPLYEASAHAAHAPMRFGDINEVDGRSIETQNPITNVPTVLVLQGNREVARISGYLGPENFLRVIERILAGLE